MGRRFGTIPGWQRASEFTMKNRVYTGTASLIIETPPEGVTESNAHIYRVKFGTRLYFYDSPADVPVVTRLIDDQIIIQILDHEYPGGLEAWTDNITREYAKEVWGDSQRELSGLAGSGGDDFIIDVTEKDYKAPPKPAATPTRKVGGRIGKAIKKMGKK